MVENEGHFRWRFLLKSENFKHLGSLLDSCPCCWFLTNLFTYSQFAVLTLTHSCFCCLRNSRLGIQRMDGVWSLVVGVLLLYWLYMWSFYITCSCVLQCLYISNCYNVFWSFCSICIWVCMFMYLYPVLWMCSAKFDFMYGWLMVFMSQSNLVVNDLPPLSATSLESINTIILAAPLSLPITLSMSRF